MASVALRIVALVLAAGLAAPATAAAITMSAGPPDSAADRERGTIIEDEGGWVAAGVTGSETEARRLVVTFRSASGPACAADPAADAGPVIIDGTHRPGQPTLIASIKPGEPGAYRACGWELDGTGAVADRGELAVDVLAVPVEASVTTDAARTFRGVPLGVFVSLAGGPNRIGHVAAVAGNTCPAAVPAPDAPGVRWVTTPVGVPLPAPRDVQGEVTFTEAGDFSVCGWVTEPGDAVAEKVAAEAVAVSRARLRPAIAVSGRRGGGIAHPLVWTAKVFGAFSGKLVLEVRRHAYRYDRSGSPRSVGVGRWRRLARVDAAKLPRRPGANATKWGTTSYLRARGKVRVPNSIGAQRCYGNLWADSFWVRLRFLGTTFAAPARSKPVAVLARHDC